MSYNIEIYKVPETIVIIRNWFNEDELQKVWQELDVVCSPFIMKDEKESKSARNENGMYLKKGHGLFLDTFYMEKRNSSHILQLNRKIFDRDLLSELVNADPFYNHYINCNYDCTLVNYYENNSEYNTHKDNDIFTANIVLWREPKKFDGGKFLITDDQLDFDLKSNDIIFFPGFSKHSVTKITMHDDATPWRSGRYSIVNFINYRI